MSTDLEPAPAPPPPPPPRGWRRLQAKIREQIAAVMNAGTSPTRLGVAVGVGVLFGCSPFFGLQTVLALAVAWPLRLNKLGVLAGTQISLPPLIPFIVFGGANLGELMLHGRFLPMSLDTLRAAPPEQIARQFFMSWFVGGMTLGALLGVLIGTGTAYFVHRRRRQG